MPEKRHPEHLLLQQIITQIEESAEVKRRMLTTCAASIQEASAILIDAVRKGGKILLCGNGGSAADAQHLATELVSRLKLERPAIAALALTTNTSILTAIGNDYQYDLVFVRQVEAFGKSGDVLIGISTSGNSPNVIRAIEYANMAQIKTLAMTGETGGKLAAKAGLTIRIPSTNVQRIQEAHITVGHILCDLLESALYGKR